MSSNNPHAVAYIFRDYARVIHKKAVPADPNYLRICVACGKVRPRFPSISWPAFPSLSRSSLSVLTMSRVDRTMGRTPLPVLRLARQGSRRRRRLPEPLRPTQPNSRPRAHTRVREAQTRRDRRWRRQRRRRRRRRRGGGQPAAHAARRRHGHAAVAAVLGRRGRPRRPSGRESGDCVWRDLVLGPKQRGGGCEWFRGRRLVMLGVLRYLWDGPQT